MQWVIRENLMKQHRRCLGCEPFRAVFYCDSIVFCSVQSALFMKDHSCGLRVSQLWFVYTTVVVHALHICEAPIPHVWIT